MEPKDRQTPPDARAQHRAYVLEHVVNGGLTIDQAAAILRLSTRQVDRLLARYDDGPAALAHGNRGRTPANRLDEGLRGRVVELATTTYAGVNHTHLAQLLAERKGVEIAARTLRRILAENSIRPTRTRRPARHRSRRERMAREGQLLQVDGSRHRWFGPDLPFATLVGGIDDATGRVPGGMFRAQEDAVGYFTTLAQTADRYGLPGAIYSDRHGIFIVEQNRAPTLAEQLTGKRSLTQVGRALDEAAIGWIGARSAEAKRPGRAAVGDAPGPARRRAPARRGHHDRGGQRVPAGLPRAPQRAVRRPGRRPRAGLAAVARRPVLRGGLLLPLSASGRPGQHGQLAGR